MRQDESNKYFQTDGPPGIRQIQDQKKIDKNTRKVMPHKEKT